MSEKIFACKPSGLALARTDAARDDLTAWFRIGVWHSMVGNDAHYDTDPAKPCRLYGNLVDGKMVVLGRLVDHTDKPRYRPLTDGERVALGLDAAQAAASVSVAVVTRPRAVFNWEVEKYGHGIRGWRLCVDRIECVGGAIGPRDQFQVAFIAIGERGTFTATVNDRAVGRNSLHETKEYVRTALGIPAEDIEEEESK